MVNFTWCRFAVGSVSPITARDAKPIVACNIGIRGYCNSLNFHGSDPALFLAREHTEFAGVAKRLRLFFACTDTACIDIYFCSILWVSLYQALTTAEAL